MICSCMNRYISYATTARQQAVASIVTGSKKDDGTRYLYRLMPGPGVIQYTPGTRYKGPLRGVPGGVWRKNYCN